ncbi:MAG TPA: dienelactone hydrolase family protein [Mariprofundaceae bacterium]|nr:dienelactone hydrolase family protein [Mariprofundaceae bacterium]
MSTPLLPCVTVETGPAPEATVIWLHGLGADGHDFEPVVPELHLPDELPVRFIFPHASAIAVTINGGYIMPAWYDIKQTDLGIEHDEAGIRASAQQIQMLIERERMHGMPANRIMLAGFSQGGAMALHVGLRQSTPLAGIIALSAYLLLPESHANPDALSAPVFMAHGINDPVVPFFLGDESRRKLERQGCRIAWHTYPMEHQVCTEEIGAIGKWISHTLSGTD